MTPHRGSHKGDCLFLFRNHNLLSDGLSVILCHPPHIPLMHSLRSTGATDKQGQGPSGTRGESGGWGCIFREGLGSCHLSHVATWLWSALFNLKRWMEWTQTCGSVVCVSVTKKKTMELHTLTHTYQLNLRASKHLAWTGRTNWSSRMLATNILEQTTEHQTDSWTIVLLLSLSKRRQVEEVFILGRDHCIHRYNTWAVYLLD